MSMVPREPNGSTVMSPAQDRVLPVSFLALKEYGLAVPGRVVTSVSRTLIGVYSVRNGLRRVRSSNTTRPLVMFNKKICVRGKPPFDFCGTGGGVLALLNMFAKLNR